MKQHRTGYVSLVVYMFQVYIPKQISFFSPKNWCECRNMFANRLEPLTQRGPNVQRQVKVKARRVTKTLVPYKAALVCPRGEQERARADGMFGDRSARAGKTPRATSDFIRTRLRSARWTQHTDTKTPERFNSPHKLLNSTAPALLLETRLFSPKMTRRFSATFTFASVRRRPLG